MEGSLGIFPLINSISFVKDGFLPEIIGARFKFGGLCFFRMEQKHDEAVQKRIHSSGVTGSDCDYWDLGGIAIASSSSGS